MSFCSIGFDNSKSEIGLEVYVSRPDFIIAGTQKAGTTWLRYNLFNRPDITGVNRQLHFFDKYYDKGLDWYCQNFTSYSDEALVGEKTTEYFDTHTAEMVACRLAKDCPDTKVIIILREPISRAFSALQHMVISGLEPLPKDPNVTLSYDQKRSKDKSFRYIERGRYADQLEPYYKHLGKDKVLVLIFEEDIVADPLAGLTRCLEFLNADTSDVKVHAEPVNARRLSAPAIRLMRTFRSVPYMRSIIWRLDMHSQLKRWRPEFSENTRKMLQELYTPENIRVFDLLGRTIPSWEYR